MSVVEIVEEGITVVEIVTAGPQGPPGADGGLLIEREMTAGETTITTSGNNELIICNNTAAATVVLNASPASGERVFVTRKNGTVTFPATILGVSGRSIDSVGDLITLIWSSVSMEWIIG